MENTIDNTNELASAYLAEKEKQRIDYDDVRIAEEVEEFGRALTEFERDIVEALERQDAFAKIVLRLHGLEVLAASIADGMTEDSESRYLVELLASNLGEAISELENVTEV